MAIRHKRDRTKSLEEWLEKVRASKLWSLRADNFVVEGWLVNGRVLLVQHFTGNGWGLFTPPSDSDYVADTLAAAEKALKLRISTPDKEEFSS